MTGPITIVIVRALGLSGASWFNLVLGSQRDAMAMGPPARILDLPVSEADHACYVHRERCDLWPAFLRQRDHCGRFFSDLAEFTGKRVFIVNYPPKALIAREIDNQGFRVLHIRLVRDGRAALYSRMRHYGTLIPGAAAFHIVDWQARVWERVDRKMPDDPAISLVVRHEDMVRNPEPELERIGDFIGIRYEANATRFWEYPQHPTGGNTGVVDLLCQMMDEKGHANRRSEAYAKLARDLQQDPDRPYLDEAWVEGLSPEDKLAFDCLLGERNARFGYARDRFPTAEREAFWRNLDRIIAKGRATDGIKTEAAPASEGGLRPLLARLRACAVPGFGKRA